MNIILTGMRGAGKSTIGKKLSKKLNKDFLDLDKFLEKKLGMKISEIVEKKGWDYFRKQEATVAQELNVKNAVVATGGGVILRKDNVQALKKDGILIFLNASAKILSSRIENDGTRPPFIKGYAAKDELDKVLKQRKDIYEETADIIINTENLNASKVVNGILKKFKNLYMVIGNPVDHSLSPKIHNAGYKALRIDNKYHYIKCNITVSGLEIFIKDIKKLKIRGVSCTIPHKVEIIQYLDEIDNVAKKIGAVNTIVNKKGILKGYNTDYLGILIPLEKITSLKNKKVIILGAGGAARAACYAVSKRNGKIIIYNRTFKKAAALAKEFDGEVLSLKTLKKIKMADIIINSTSVGLHPYENESPLAKKYISGKQIIFDLIYAPHRTTKFLTEAKEKHAKIILGTEMLLYQGVEQFKLFTGHDAPIGVMRKALI